MNQNLRFVLLREIPEGDANLRQQWDALVARMDRPQVFYTWEWALAVQRAYHSTLRPLVFLAYGEHGPLRGLAAIALDEGGTKASFLCATTGDYCDFISSTDDRFDLVSGVLAELRTQGINDLTLTNLPADSASVAALQRASKHNRYQCFMRTAYECAQVSFERLERGKDGKPLAPGKKRISRLAKALADEGSVQFVHSRSWNSVAPILPGFVRAHVVRFLETGRISNLVSARRRKFLAELSQLLSGPGWLVVSRMTVGERTIAWHYGFQLHDTWFWYQPTFDSRAQKHWPGFCLLTQVIEDATRIPELTNIDLGLGSEAYKAKFANAMRRTLYVTLHSSRLKHWKEMARYRAAATITARPRAERAVRKLLGKVDALKRRVREQGLVRTAGWVWFRMRKWIFSREEVFFLEAGGAAAESVGENSLHPVSFELLADAAMQCCGDEQTMQYLLRGAKRLREGGAEGFVLVDSGGGPLHFAWVTNFDGFFLSELNARVDAPASDCVMIFDCWTPAQSRGHGYYGEAVGLIARLFRERGKTPWIFSAASNSASLRGLAKAGFRERYSLVRRRALGRQTIMGKTPRLDAASTEVEARV